MAIAGLLFRLPGTELKFVLAIHREAIARARENRRYLVQNFLNVLNFTHKTTREQKANLYDQPRTLWMGKFCIRPNFRIRFYSTFTT